LGSMERIPHAGALRVVMEAAGPAPMVVLEATYGWYWAVETAARFWVLRCILRILGCERVFVSAGQKRRTWPLIWRICCGWDASGSEYCRRTGSALRELVRYRAKLSRWRTSAKSSIHAVLAKRGVVGRCRNLFGAPVTSCLMGWFSRRPTPPGWSSLRDLLRMLETEIRGSIT